MTGASNQTDNINRHKESRGSTLSAFEIEDSTRFDDIPSNYETTSSRSARRKSFDSQSWWWWWWWEIMAMVVCIASTIGLIVLLISINNTALRQWRLPIRPNSVIAVLTTISKTALLVPAASCISQLKWRYFSGQPRRLTDLQLFDAASRGPWGSLALLFRLSNPIKAMTVIGFALLTILTLGIDASAQQLLLFPTQETEIENESIVMGTATSYFSKSTNLGLPSKYPNPRLIPLQYQLISSLRGSTFQSYYTCPQQATRCTWEALTTLGVCGSWNSAPVVSDGCDIVTGRTPSFSNATYAACNYTLSNSHSENAALANQLYPQLVNLTYRIPAVDYDSGNKVFHSTLIPGPNQLRTEFGEFFALRAPKNTTAFQTPADFKPPIAEAFYASFWWCSKTFRGITVDPNGAKYASVSSERLTFSFMGPANGINHDASYNYVTNSTGTKYTIDSATYQALTMYLYYLLRAQAYEQLIEIDTGTILSTGNLLYQDDLGNMTTSLADSMTNIMRSSFLDENFNITNVPGKGFYDETYIRVRWVWILIPLTETTLITVLFTLSVILTSRQPLLKDSVLAYLSTAMEDGKGSKSELRMTQWTTQAELDDEAEDMIVKLEPDEQGRLRFFRKDTHSDS
ncbi:hypothetical protein F5Y19DRAFT_325574 [Xylariaceae sp. FL1651]|nr:hypothetical protein F5Y19DRAFT_325574 [Xylariaceae sp. FL1651]